MVATLKGGYTGKILRVDLTRKESRVEELDPRLAAAYIGGAGLGIKLLYDALPAGVDPLSPENVLIFAPGPMTGTDAPCASRMAVIARSPLTGGLAMALSAGHFPAELKFAGFDAVIIEGKAESPVYLYIKDGEVQFRNAERLWGMMTTDTQLFIKEEVGDHNTRVACIGPAGEKLCRIACIINERRAAGRKGVGAVMGSKNLKAIAVRGTGKVVVDDPQSFSAVLKDMHKLMRDDPALYPGLAKVGTSAAVDVTSAMGIWSAKNWMDTGVFSPVDKLGSQALDQFTIRRNPCYRCPVACSQVRLARYGGYAGVLTEGPEFETIYSLGTNVGVDDPAAVITADRLCDEYGLDSISTGVTISLAMELYERGILGREEVDGLELRFGNAQAVLELIVKMANRDGFGDVLADGSRLAARRIGRGAERYAMHIKGLELPAYDIRGAKAHGLNYITSYTGADHNRGYAFQEIFGVPVPEPVDRLAVEGKGKLCKWNQDFAVACFDSPTFCNFLNSVLGFEGPRIVAGLLNAASGLSLSPEDVWKVGERIMNLARVFIAREGFSRADDTLPSRLMEEPLKGGASAGQLISREDLDKMLDEYYEARGWDKETGLPTKEKLVELGLDYTVEAVEKAKAALQK
ncbi:aldehyde ferredoxin oxidoreductase family protein [Moorellaceae bacterium AZ2]